MSSLFDAIESGSVKNVEKLLTNQNINSRREALCPKWNGEEVKEGLTPLMLAMRRGNDPIAQLLLAKGADPKLTDQFGKTAMMMACEFGHGDMPALKEIIKTLTVKELQAKDQWDQTLIMYAATVGFPIVVDLLLNKEGDAGVHASKDSPDLLSISAAHGQAQVVDQLLRSKRRSSIVTASQRISSASLTPAPAPSYRAVEGKKLEPGERIVSGALIVACTSGHWIESLFENFRDKLNDTDEFGITPLMYALCFGHDEVARKLIEKGTDVTAEVDASSFSAVSDLPEAAKLAVSLDKKPMLTIALEKGAQLETIRALVLAGAETKIPPVKDALHSPVELLELFSDPMHPIGLCLTNAMEQKNEPEKAKLIYQMARLMLAAAFRESPGAALCAFVAVALTMRNHAESVRLENLEFAEFLNGEADEVGLSVGAFLDTLPMNERERVLFSTPGKNFLRFAADSECRKMLFCASVTNHMAYLWDGEAISCANGGFGIYQWGGRMHMPAIHSLKMYAVVFVAFVLNVLLLPVLAVYPPLGKYVKSYLETLGSHGVDARMTTPWRPEGQLGYSPTLRVWWKSLYLIDVPIFKFFTAQVGSMLLLWTLFVLAPCLDYNNHDLCFTPNTTHHMVGVGDVLSKLIPFDFATHSYDDSYDDGTSSLVEEDGGRMLGDAGGMFANDMFADGVEGRMLRASGRGARIGGGKSISGLVEGHTAERRVISVGMSKDQTYILLLMYVASVFSTAVRNKGSIASSQTLLSAIGAIFLAAFLALDFASLRPINEAYDLQPTMLSTAVFLISLDVGRGILLKTFTCGPSVLMLILMFKDVFVFLILTASVSLGFALALYVNDEMKVSEVDPDCPLVPGQFYTYGLTLMETALGFSGVVDQTGCAKMRGEAVSAIILEIYLVTAVILLLNMLIAMMAETFNSVRAFQEEHYAYLNAQIVVSVHIDQSEIPPPLTILRLPYTVVKFALDMLGRAAGIEENPYAEFQTPSDPPYEHVGVAELLDKLDELDRQSNHSDMPAMIEQVEEKIDALEDLTKGEPRVNPNDKYIRGRVDTDVVRVYSGFTEDASRLVFHYSDKFGHLPNQPPLRTYLPKGIMENEPKGLPVRPEHEDAGEEAKLLTRGLVAYPYKQDFPVLAAKNVISSDGDEYVWQRENGEMGLAQIWPIKVNEQFEKKFSITYTNPNPKIFQPQAVGEFDRALCKLFGADATKRVPIMYCQNTNKNKKKIYYGSGDALQAYLREHPEACDDLKICKLFPGGFVCTTTTPKKNGFKNFDFMAGTDYVLYTKVGYESMACIKTYAAFIKECEFLEEVNDEAFSA